MSADLLATLTTLREGERTTVYRYEAHGGELCEERSRLVVRGGVWRREGEWELAEPLERNK